MKKNRMLLLLFVFLISCNKGVDYSKMYSEYMELGTVRVPKNLPDTSKYFRSLFVDGVQRLILRRDSFDVAFCKEGELSIKDIAYIQKKYEMDTVIYTNIEQLFRDSLYSSISFDIDTVNCVFNNNTKEENLHFVCSVQNMTTNRLDRSLFYFTLYLKPNNFCVDNVQYVDNILDLNANEKTVITMSASMPENIDISNLELKIKTYNIELQDSIHVFSLFPFDSLRSYDFDLSDFDIKYDTIWKRRY